jgi:hypothetical protein
MTKETGMGTTTSAHAERQTVVERITVALIARSAEDLHRTQERTGLSKTDIVNRALTLYDFIDDRLASGTSELIMRNTDTGEIELIKLL